MLATWFIAWSQRAHEKQWVPIITTGLANLLIVLAIGMAAGLLSIAMARPG